MSDIMLNMEYGDPNKPTGNAFAYWEIHTPSPKGIVSKIIVTNFIVSPLMFNKHTIAATFPPIIFKAKEEIITIANKANIDIIKVEDIEISDDNFDFAKFFKNQLNKFNTIVTQYSLLYSEYLFGKTPKEQKFTNEMEGLERITHLAEEAREAYIVKRNKTLGRELVIKMRKIGNDLNAPNFKYDIENLIILLGNPDKKVEQLSKLYFQKFLAIYTEQYEEAEKLKRKIQRLASKMGPEE